MRIRMERNAVYQTKKVTYRRGGTNYANKENKIKDDTVSPSSSNKPIVVYTNKEENAKRRQH